MKLLKVVGLMGLLIALSPTRVLADKTIHARLRGFDEVPAVSTTGSGEFRAKINNDESAIEYELSYDNLEGTTVNAAHIHVGQQGVNGGVSAFLCGGGGKPLCPLSGTVAGVIFAADVVGPVAQGVAPGELAELMDAILGGVAYVNVHTNKHPTGEIRGHVQ